MEGAEARDRRLTVGPAVVDESKPDRSIAAQRFGDEVQIFFQRVRAVDCFQPIAQAGDNIVFQILFVGDGDNTISIRLIGKRSCIFPFF